MQTQHPKIFIYLLIFFLFGCASNSQRGLTQEDKSPLEAAPSTAILPADWINGDLNALESLAKTNWTKNNQDWGALKALIFTSHMKGQYKQSAEFYKILPKNERSPLVIRATIDSLIHSSQFARARDVSMENQYKFEWYGPLMEARQRKPLRVNIRKPAKLKFVSGSASGLDPYMPGVQGKLVGSSSKSYFGTIRIDTGGEHLTLSSKRAKDLELAEISCQQGRQAENKTQVCWSQIDLLELGNARLTNVPVQIVYSLPDGFEPILGTNILQQFKSELNYPESKLVLYPRQARFPAPTKKLSCTEMPFYMWADHFMISKGHFGEQKNLNFFIDTGLIAVAPGGRQAAVKIATEDLKAWDVKFDQNEKIFNPKISLGLGSLSDDDHLVIHSPLSNLGFDFGGVRIHGLLGHAFYQKYVWRLDFDKMTYQFCQ